MMVREVWEWEENSNVDTVPCAAPREQHSCTVDEFECVNLVTVRCSTSNRPRVRCGKREEKQNVSNRRTRLPFPCGGSGQ